MRPESIEQVQRWLAQLRIELEARQAPDLGITAEEIWAAAADELDGDRSAAVIDAIAERVDLLE